MQKTKKTHSAKRSAIFLLKAKNANYLSYLFLLLSVGLRGEVDPRESLPLKSPFLTAPVFRYIVRLVFASVKHNVLVRVHMVKRGFTRPPRVLVLVPPTPIWGGGPFSPDFTLFFDDVSYFILERILE